jgi:hypothetical protein
MASRNFAGMTLLVSLLLINCGGSLAKADIEKRSVESIIPKNSIFSLNVKHLEYIDIAKFIKARGNRSDSKMLEACIQVYQIILSYNNFENYRNKNKKLKKQYLLSWK